MRIYFVGQEEQVKLHWQKYLQEQLTVLTQMTEIHVTNVKYVKVYLADRYLMYQK